MNRVEEGATEPPVERVLDQVGHRVVSPHDDAAVVGHDHRVGEMTHDLAELGDVGQRPECDAGGGVGVEPVTDMTGVGRRGHAGFIGTRRSRLKLGAFTAR